MEAVTPDQDEDELDIEEINDDDATAAANEDDNETIKSGGTNNNDISHQCGGNKSPISTNRKILASHHMSIEQFFNS